MRPETISAKENSVASPQHNPNPFKELLPSPWVMTFMLIFLGLLFYRLFTYVPEEQQEPEAVPVEQVEPSQTEPVDETL